MDDHERLMQTIPYIAYESAQARNERVVKRLIVALIIVVTMLFVSNVIWIIEWTSYDYVEEGEEIMIDAGNEGNANYIGNDGSIVNNGEDNG